MLTPPWIWQLPFAPVCGQANHRVMPEDFVKYIIAAGRTAVEVELLGLASELTCLSTPEELHLPCLGRIASLCDVCAGLVVWALSVTSRLHTVQCTEPLRSYLMHLRAAEQLGQALQHGSVQMRRVVLLDSTKWGVECC